MTHASRSLRMAHRDPPHARRRARRDAGPSERTSSIRRTTVLVTLALSSLLAACRAEPRSQGERTGPTPPAATSPATGAPPRLPQSVFHSETRWQSQRGEELALSDLAGTPLVVAMVFTSCRASCPVMMSDLLRLERELTSAERAAMRFVVVSFDSRGDTPATLRAFAEEHHLDQARWTLLRGDEDAVRELAALLDVRYVPLPQGGFDHANVLTVLDAQGAIRHRRVGLNQPPDAVLAELRALEPLASASRTEVRE